MKKICLKLCPLLFIFSGSPAVAGVDCGGVPHTRLELAICNEPVLSALDSELSAALEEARKRGIIDSLETRAKYNHIARQCRRESDTAFTLCLLDAELRSLNWISRKLDQSLADQSASDTSWRYDASLAYRASHLEQQLAVAESRLRHTGNPELTVLTLLSLIDVYRQHGNSVAPVGKLERRLALGCAHVVYGGKWGTLLQENNLDCSAIQSPAILSSSGF